ncbi:MAG: endonuclease domain-containing protein [Gemmatales bacterium]
MCELSPIRSIHTGRLVINGLLHLFPRGGYPVVHGLSMCRPSTDRNVWKVDIAALALSRFRGRGLGEGLTSSTIHSWRPVRRQISRHAARLRRNRTEAEDRFWQAVRNRQLDGCKFRFQHSLDPYVVDFVCLERSLIVELDGGQHSETSDARRTADLEASGFRVLRFWNHDVLSNLDGVLTVVRSALTDLEQ